MTLVRFGSQLRNLGIVFTPALLIRWSGCSISCVPRFYEFIMYCEIKFNLLITITAAIDAGLSPRAALSAGGETIGMPEPVIDPWP